MKLRMRLLEIFHPADIEPVFPDRVDGDAALVGDDTLQNCRHIDPYSAFYVIERGAPDQMPALTNQLGRFFPDGLEITSLVVTTP